MKFEITLDKDEAQKILGDAIKTRLAGTAAAALDVIQIEWNSYGHRVTVTLDAPEEPEVFAPAITTAA